MSVLNRAGSGAPRPPIYHWRTTNQEEVDFVVEAGTGLLAIEVKTGQRPSRQDIRHLLTFQQEYGEAVAGCLLLHGGPDILPLADRVVAAPWWSVMWAILRGAGTPEGRLESNVRSDVPDVVAVL